MIISQACNAPCFRKCMCLRRKGEKVVCAKYMFELVLKDSSLFLPEAGGGGGVVGKKGVW